MPEPNDLVQVLKQESTAAGGDSSDADPFLGYERIDENDDGLSAAGYYAQETGGSGRDKNVLLWREGDTWKGKDGTYGSVDLLAAGSGITPSQHKALRDLIHFIGDGPADGFASGAIEEVLPAGDPFPTSSTWYTDGTKTEKIVDQTVVYNANKTVSTSTWRIYDTDGSTVLITLVDTFSYSGVFSTGRTRTWS